MLAAVQGVVKDNVVLVQNDDLSRYNASIYRCYDSSDCNGA